jgi:hypothetical protein
MRQFSSVEHPFERKEGKTVEKSGRLWRTAERATKRQGEDGT